MGARDGGVVVGVDGVLAGLAPELVVVGVLGGLDRGVEVSAPPKNLSVDVAIATTGGPSLDNYSSNVPKVDIISEAKRWAQWPG